VPLPGYQRLDGNDFPKSNPCKYLLFITLQNHLSACQPQSYLVIADYNLTRIQPNRNRFPNRTAKYTQLQNLSTPIALPPSLSHSIAVLPAEPTNNG
jgi:hypothetical protein